MKHVSALGEELIQYGADRVVVVEDAKLKSIYIRWLCSSILAVIEQEKPEGIIFGHTALGKDLSPKIAGKLHPGLFPM